MPEWRNWLYANDSKSFGEIHAGSTPASGTSFFRDTNAAYIIGIAIGDGNLSNPNGRAVRLRVTCDNKYPALRNKIVRSLQLLLPNNKTSLVFRKSNCVDVSCYSNHFEHILG